MGPPEDVDEASELVDENIVLVAMVELAAPPWLELVVDATFAPPCVDELATPPAPPVAQSSLPQSVVHFVL